ncbi:glycosyltransferase family 1 protein [Reyranella sp.]|uniref:glycosyltransferase family 1 protein n=1 Tax=Reyranella sp. TaxID=1929291 RepID=UPI00121D4EE4|nr:glycosyltransferase family 1 protein [Reyranella sp.]TAJ87536.1 MAG: glycosyltransferase family 1 protein [Reyranella sp.]
MHTRPPLNLFYEEPDADRWTPFDRYPRRMARWALRGPKQPGGTMRVYLNLRAGLDRLGVRYRDNDFRYLHAHPNELACVIGQPLVLDKLPKQTPILFGTSIYNHPNDNPDLPRQRPIRRVLVPCAWTASMFSTVWPGLVSAWPAGIDTDRWSLSMRANKDVDVLVYDKIVRHRGRYLRTIVAPLVAELRRRNLSFRVLRYGFYREEQLHRLSRRARSMVYLSHHETQGLAAQQILSSGIPILAWDHGGLWKDPTYAPHRVRFAPVTSVPYWDERCGVKFRGGADLLPAFDEFWFGVEAGIYTPREMIVESLTLEQRARSYLDLVDQFGGMS